MTTTRREHKSTRPCTTAAHTHTDNKTLLQISISTIFGHFATLPPETFNQCYTRIGPFREFQNGNKQDASLLEGEMAKKKTPRIFLFLFFISYQVFTSLPSFIAPVIWHACRPSAEQSVTEAFGSLAGTVYPHSRIPQRVECMRRGGSSRWLPGKRI